MILVMAATGMFGRGVVRSLAQLGQPVRATGRSLTRLSSSGSGWRWFLPIWMIRKTGAADGGVDRVLVNAHMDDNKESRERNIIQAMINTDGGLRLFCSLGGWPR